MEGVLEGAANSDGNDFKTSLRCHQMKLVYRDGVFSDRQWPIIGPVLAVLPLLLAKPALAAESPCNRRTCQMRQPLINLANQSGGLLGPALRPTGNPTASARLLK